MDDTALLAATTRVNYPEDEQGRRKIDEDADERDNGFSGKRHYRLGVASLVRWLWVLIPVTMETATELGGNRWVLNI